MNTKEIIFLAADQEELEILQDYYFLSDENKNQQEEDSQNFEEEPNMFFADEQSELKGNDKQKILKNIYSFAEISYIDISKSMDKIEIEYLIVEDDHINEIPYILNALQKESYMKKIGVCVSIEALSIIKEKNIVTPKLFITIDYFMSEENDPNITSKDFYLSMKKNFPETHFIGLSRLLNMKKFLPSKLAEWKDKLEKNKDYVLFKFFTKDYSYWDILPTIFRYMYNNLQRYDKKIEEYIALSNTILIEINDIKEKKYESYNRNQSEQVLGITLEDFGQQQEIQEFVNSTESFKDGQVEYPINQDRTQYQWISISKSGAKLIIHKNATIARGNSKEIKQEGLQMARDIPNQCGIKKEIKQEDLQIARDILNKYENALRDIDIKKMPVIENKFFAQCQDKTFKWLKEHFLDPNYDAIQELFKREPTEWPKIRCVKYFLKKYQEGKKHKNKSPKIIEKLSK